MKSSPLAGHHAPECIKHRHPEEVLHLYDHPGNHCGGFSNLQIVVYVHVEILGCQRFFHWSLLKHRLLFLSQIVVFVRQLIYLSVLSLCHVCAIIVIVIIIIDVVVIIVCDRIDAGFVGGDIAGLVADKLVVVVDELRGLEFDLHGHVRAAEAKVPQVSKDKTALLHPQVTVHHQEACWCYSLPVLILIIGTIFFSLTFNSIFLIL